MTRPSRKRSIFHICPSFDIGGAERRTARLISADMPFQHRVLALNGHYGALSLIPDDHRQHIRFDGAFPSCELSFLRHIRAIRAFLKQEKPDLIVTYNWGTIEWALANAFFPICPLLHIQDGFGVDEYNSQISRRLLARRFAYGRAAAVVVPSITLLNLAKSSWNLTGPSLQHIPNGIPVDRFRTKADPAALTALGITPGDPLIVTLAALRPEKNLGRLIEAFLLLADDYPTARLLIIGDGVARPALQTLAQRSNAGARIIFAGATDSPERLLPAATLFALSSDTEQMPLVIMEAMAAGLPLVSTDVGDIKNMLSAENAGLVDGRSSLMLTEHMRILLRDPARAKSIGAANQKKAVAAFDEAQMIRRYRTLFDKLTARSRH